MYVLPSSPSQTSAPFLTILSSVTLPSPAHLFPHVSALPLYSCLPFLPIPLIHFFYFTTICPKFHSSFQPLPSFCLFLITLVLLSSPQWVCYHSLKEKSCLRRIPSNRNIPGSTAARDSWWMSVQLPCTGRIDFKVILLIHKSLNGLGLAYITLIFFFLAF